MFLRQLKLPTQRSFFLFGPRQTGKTTLLKESLSQKGNLHINLLDPGEEMELQADPAALWRRLESLEKNPPWIVIYEIQKIPKLLDVVHHFIEAKGMKFALTGSSARKLRHGGANLLAGRVFMRNLYPLTHVELGKNFKLESVLQYGSLPTLFQMESQEEKIEFLKNYAHTYLKEEIVAEQLVRKIQPFRRFIEIAAQCNGQIINMARISREIGADFKTVQNYFEILEDTLIGFTLPNFHESLRKRQTLAGKFYFFDTGVKRAVEMITHLPLEEKTYGFGNAFEHWMILEIRRLAEYAGKEWRFSHLRTSDNQEIDLIIDRPGEKRYFIEFKSATRVESTGLGFLEKCAEESSLPGEPLLIGRFAKRTKVGKVLCLPWKESFEHLGLI